MFTELQLIKIQNLIRSEKIRVYNRRAEWFNKYFFNKEITDRDYDYNCKILDQEIEELEKVQTIVEEQIEKHLEQNNIQNQYKQLYILSNIALQIQDQYIEQTISYNEYQDRMSEINKQKNEIRKQINK